MSFELMKVIHDNTTGTFNNMNEAVQLDVADKVLDKIFVLTIGKYNKIDFSEIEKSKGDITRIKFYKNLSECLNTLSQINSVTHKIEDVEVINKSIAILIKLKPHFEYAFKVKNTSGMMIYNLVCYSIMEATSYLIATSVNFVTEQDLIVSSTNADNLLISSLRKFNASAEKGEIYRFIKDAEQSMDSQNESVVVSSVFDFLAKHHDTVVKVGTIAGLTAAGLLLIANIGSIVREMATIIYKTKHKISEAAQVQADMLELNIELLKGKDGDVKIITKQQKWVERFKKISEKFALDSDKSKRDADRELKSEKVDIDSIVI